VARDGQTTLRELLIAWLHLAVLWCFAFAKPLFDVLADAPEFFVARGNTRGDILLFAFAMVLVPPSILVLVEALAVRVPKVRRALHLVFVGALAGAFVLQLVEDAFGGGGAALLAVGAVAGAAIAFAYARIPALPSVLTVLAPAPVIFLAIFLLTSPVSKLVLPQEDAKASDVDIRSTPPVVMVVFDEFASYMLMDEERRIDRTRYPNFAAFADDSVWYRNATTVSDGTVFAVPALLSGRRPDKDSLPIAADYPDNVFTLLGGSYEIDAVETATSLCPKDLCGERDREPFGPRLRSLAEDLGVVSLHLVLPEGLRSHLPAVDQTFGNFRGGGQDAPATGTGAAGSPGGDAGQAFSRNRRSAFAAFMQGIQDTPRPTFHFVHLAFPHTPLQYLPSGQQYVADYAIPGLTNETWGPDPALVRRGLQRHLLQVGYVDRLLGQLVARLRRSGLYDDALVVVTADHGVSYRAGLSRRGVTPETAGEIAGVPLLIKYPGQRRGQVDDSMARTMDIVPTIADELGVRLAGAKGVSLRSGTARAGEVVEVSVSNTENSVRISLDDFERLHRAALSRMIASFGASDGGAGLYGMGDTRLLGRPVAGLVSQANAPARVELANADLYTDVRPDARLLPSLVRGDVVGSIRADSPLAVAVNGRVSAVTDAVTEDGAVQLDAMVPPDAFRAGNNTIDVFAVDGTVSRPQLVRLDVERPATYRLAERDGNPAIVGVGSEARVEPGRGNGYVEALKLDDQVLQVSGWAVDPEGKRPVQRLLVFDGTRLIAQTRPTEARADIAKKYGTDTVTQSGFRLSTSATGVELSDIRIIALSGDRAIELDQ
jgi:Sulfatase